MNRDGKPHALLATARIANVPSVVSNVWLGVAIGGYAFGGASAGAIAAVLVSGVLLYLGGNFLNDWMDREWDSKHRPERALPRGLFSARLYLALAGGLMASGVVLGFAAGVRSGLVAAAIVGCIGIYTAWHKRGAWTVVPMGLCRGLLPVMGCFAFHPFLNAAGPAAAGLFCHIVGLSLTARHESMAEPGRVTGAASRLLLLATVVFLALANRALLADRLWMVIGALPYLAWTSFVLRCRRRPVPRLVSGLLAGIPLIDWMVLLGLGVLVFQRNDPGTLPFALGCLLIPPAAFLSALALQRVAPAT